MERAANLFWCEIRRFLLVFIVLRLSSVVDTFVYAADFCQKAFAFLKQSGSFIFSVIRDFAV
jgi:hypothetical protein